MDNTKEISRSECVEMINKRDGETHVILRTVTEPKLKKRDNPYKGVTRTSSTKGTIGGEYGRAVNDQQEVDGGERDFTPKPLPWGEHAGRYFIAHKGAMYLKFQSREVLKEEWTDESGVVLSPQQLAPFLPARSEKSGGVSWRTIKLSSIHEITIDAVIYKLVDPAPVDRAE